MRIKSYLGAGFILASSGMVAATTITPELWVEPESSLTFVRVPKGCHRIGTQELPFKFFSQSLREAKYAGEPAGDEKPAHEVCLSEYWIGQYEVTAEQWQRIMGAPPPSGQGREPAAGITWQQAREFAVRLTAQSAEKNRFRLPTEAEWEVACLAGEKDPLQTEVDRMSYAPYAVFHRSISISGKQKERVLVMQPQPVGSLRSNAWGIYDMRGNVWEWVQDNYLPDAYQKHGLYDPLIAAVNGLRGLRGGSYRSEVMHLRCANRGNYPESETLPTMGLRLVREAQR